MLEIRDVHFFPDGRSVVDTIGGRRFKVVSRGKRDGYNTARVEFLADRMLAEEEADGELEIVHHHWLACRVKNMSIVKELLFENSRNCKDLN